MVNRNLNEQEDLKEIANVIYPTLSNKTSFMKDVYLEDGPVFRATIKQLEDRTINLKSSLKKIMKTATASFEMRRQLIRIDETYFEALSELQYTEPLMHHYLDLLSKAIRLEKSKSDQFILTQLFEPLQKLYDEDIKMADLKRKQFEDESKDYYGALAKYLKSRKKGESSEKQKKQNQRKSKFDLARFDYLNFLLNIHGHKKENEILSCIIQHTISNFNHYPTFSDNIQDTPHLVELFDLLTKKSVQEQDLLSQERENKRKELMLLCDKPKKNLESSVFVPLEISENEAPLNCLKELTNSDQLKPNTRHNRRRKEGFLFATAKPAKTTSGFDVPSANLTWHKYWCVLSNGQLHEYSNWKRHLESNIDPINLKFATVREARNAERRFCFEVITPHIRRIYQATSQEEANKWIETIQNSIESLINRTSSSSYLFDPIILPKRHGKTLSSALKASSPRQYSIKNRKRQSNPLLHHSASVSSGAGLLVSTSSGPGDRFRWSGFSFGQDKSNSNKSAALYTIQQSSNNNGAYVFPCLSFDESNTKLLSILRKDPSNRYCADCDTKNPDWCSLNLGILLCIECSGIHRSLGTHVSKIRSLTLDNNSYTPDIIELLKSIGNAKSNTIWDQQNNLEVPRPTPTDPRSTKLRYIQSKYVKKLFVKKRSALDPTDPDELLFKAIDEDDLSKAIFAVAIGANVNASRIVPLKLNSILLNDSPFKDLEFFSSSNDGVRYALHQALLHGREVDPDDIISITNNSMSTSSSCTSNSTNSSCESLDQADTDIDLVSISEKKRVIFPMAEFLLQNGADTGIVDAETGRTLAEIVGMDLVLDDQAIDYINMKNTARGQSTITRSSTMLNHDILSIQQHQELQHYLEIGKSVEEALSIKEERKKFNL